MARRAGPSATSRADPARAVAASRRARAASQGAGELGQHDVDVGSAAVERVPSGGLRGVVPVARLGGGRVGVERGSVWRDVLQGRGLAPEHRVPLPHRRLQRTPGTGPGECML
eukprot:423713-Rhodomonas_salina.1